MAKARFDPAALRAEPDNPLLDPRAEFPKKDAQKKAKQGTFVLQAVGLVLAALLVGSLIVWYDVQSLELYLLLVMAWWFVSFLDYVLSPSLRPFLLLRRSHARAYFEAGVTVAEIVQAKATLLHGEDFKNRWLLGVVAWLPPVSAGILACSLYLNFPAPLHRDSIRILVTLAAIFVGLGVWLSWSLPRCRRLWLLREVDTVFLGLELKLGLLGKNAPTTALRPESLPGLWRFYPGLGAMIYLFTTFVLPIIVMFFMIVFYSYGAEKGAGSWFVALFMGLVCIGTVLGIAISVLYSMEGEMQEIWANIQERDNLRWQAVVQALEEQAQWKRR